MRTVTLRTLLDASIREEQEAQGLYRAAATRARDEATRRFLEALIVEESRHEQDLRALAARVDAEQVTLALDDAAGADGAVRDTNASDASEDAHSIRGLLLIALKREKRASAVYARMADAARDPVARSVLMSLAAAEEDHARRIRGYFQLSR